MDSSTLIGHVPKINSLHIKMLSSLRKHTSFKISGALRDLVSFVLYKKHEKHPWRSVTFSKACNIAKSNTPPWLFFTFLKLYKWYKIAQSIAYFVLFFLFAQP